MYKASRLFLLPIAFLLKCFSRLRRNCYLYGILKQYSPPVTTIAVGNLRFGGTGKTPFIQYLALQFDQNRRKTAILSRGYKRKSSGYMPVTESSTVETVGDEAMLLFNSIGKNTTMHVCEKRPEGIKNIIHHDSTIDCILLDDAFQHLQVNPSLNIILTSFNQPFFYDSLFPIGRLTEPRDTDRYADLIIVSKCPSGMAIEATRKIKLEIEKYNRKAPVLFASVKYPPLVPHISKPAIPGGKVVLVSGIAEADPLQQYINSNYQLVRHFKFPDHHWYSESEMETIIRHCKKEQSVLVTTSKDIAKLKEYPNHKSVPVYEQPMELYFLFNGDKKLSELISAN